jgi:hypothetical protein
MNFVTISSIRAGALMSDHESVWVKGKNFDTRFFCSSFQSYPKDTRYHVVVYKTDSLQVQSERGEFTSLKQAKSFATKWLTN